MEQLTITKKSRLKPIVKRLIELYYKTDKQNFVNTLNTNVLRYKIKFPLLEFVGEELYKNLPEDDHVELCDLIYAKGTMGGLVVIGKILQLRLGNDGYSAIDKARDYIALADEWYICDIIGERVFGYGMRYHSNLYFNYILQLFNDENRWVLRGMGAGSHFAIKRGVSKELVEHLLIELLKHARSKDKEIKQGIGWAGKTTAKFHPELIELYSDIINNTSKVDQWFRGKVNIGLDRAAYLKQKNAEKKE